MPKYKTSDSFVQADGAQEILTPNRHKSTTQVSIGGDSTSGSLQIRAKYHQDANFETVFEADGTTPLVIDLADPKSFQLMDKWLYSLEVTPISVDASYKLCIVSGEED